MNGNISAVNISGSALPIGADGIGIKSITKTSSDGLIDTYTIFFTDDNTSSFSFTVKNGEKGEKGEKGDTGETGAEGVGITKIEKTGSVGLEDYYTITLSNKDEYKFTVKNGVGIEKIEKFDSVGLEDYYLITLSNKGEYTFSVKNGKDGEKGDTGAKGPKGDKGDKGEDGKDGKDAVVISTDVELVGTTGDSETAVMTQKATTEAIKNVTVGKNKVGTWAYNITGYSGKNGGSGGYFVDGGDGEIQALSELVYTSGVPIKCTIRVYTDEIGTWFDSYFTISGVIGTSKGILLSVENLYTNSVHTEYDENATYSEKGVDRVYPELGYYIQHGKAILFICGHPGFGSFKFNTIGASFGEDNISQGEFSFNGGYGNWASGKYSSNFGNGNKAGYDTHTHGRNIDAAMAKDSILAGYGHKITDLVNSVALFGWMLECGFSYQTICGLWNKNKGCNLLEVGNGTSELNKQNAFEVDKNGLISANEKYIPNQTVYKGKYTTTNTLTNIVSGGTNVECRSPYSLGGTFSKTSNETSAYCGYVYVDKDLSGLEVGQTYYMFVTYKIKKNDTSNGIINLYHLYYDTKDNFNMNVVVTEKYESRDYIVAMPFTVTDDIQKYGIGTNLSKEKMCDVTIGTDIRLFKAETFKAELPINTKNTDLMANGLKCMRELQPFVWDAHPDVVDYFVNVLNNDTIMVVPTNYISSGTELDIKIMSGEPVSDARVKYLLSKNLS